MNELHKNINNILSKLVYINPPPIRDDEIIHNEIIHDEIIHDETITLEEKRSDPAIKPHIELNIYLKMFIHELRTPLSTISLGLNLLNTNKTEKKIVHDMKESVVFIEDIFSKFAVIQDGNIELNEFKPFSINYIIKRVEFLLRYLLKEGNVLFNYIIAPEIYDWNYGDRFNIKHCIINLLKNAVKYRDTTVQNTVTITVMPVVNSNKNDTIPHRPSNTMFSQNTHIRQSARIIHETKKKQTVCISIIDNNPYILPKIKERLFEAFNTTSGSGLGLYICKNIVDLHGGTITHEYVQPIGNKFIITLTLDLCEDPILQVSPYIYEFIEPDISKTESSNTEGSNTEGSNTDSSKSKTDTDNTKETSEDKTSEDDATPNLSTKSPCGRRPLTSGAVKPNLLLIDDSRLNCKMMYKSFKKTGVFYNIYTCLDVNVSFTRIENHMDKIDVIFLDKNMPGMDGLEVASKLRQTKYDKLIFGITGEDDPVERQRFIESGVDYVITKPVDTNKINQISDFITRNGIMRHHQKIIQHIHGVLTWSATTISV